MEVDEQPVTTNGHVENGFHEEAQEEPEESEAKLSVETATAMESDESDASSSDSEIVTFESYLNQRQPRTSGYKHKQGTELVLWTLSRLLRNNKLRGTNEDFQDAEEEDAALAELLRSKEKVEQSASGYTLESLLAKCPTPQFDIQVEQQINLPIMPFPNMDRSNRGVCRSFSKGYCPNGQHCHLRHLKGEKTVVCKHWLRGLCKKGDDCEFLHEYDLSKMPECFFFSKYNACSNKECPFRHIDPEQKIKDCPWYDRGFCRHGPFCKYRHRRRVMCEAYMCGFCPLGPDCTDFHPENTIVPPEVPSTQRLALLCHNCHEKGHKASNCPHLPMRKPGGPPMMISNSRAPVPGFENRRSLADIVCYKCGNKGHYANRCTVAVTSFLKAN